MSTTQANTEMEERKFKVLLNGNEDLQQQLEEFKRSCAAHEKLKRKRSKRRYYHIGLMAKIVAQTTEDELKSLLKNGTRTFLIDAVTNKPQEFDQILERTNSVISVFQQEEAKTHQVTGLAIELHGDCCRMGRMRNNCSVLLHQGDIITLTIDEAYKYSCFKQISYVINLKYYLKSLKLNDEIVIGREVQGKIVKCLRDNVAVQIDNAGLVNSYEYIELPNQCYSLKDEMISDLFKNDLELAASSAANYIVIPKIRCKPFMKILRQNLTNNYNLKIIGSIDLEFVSSKMLDLMGIIKLLDYIWIPDMFTVGPYIQNYINEDVIPLAKCLKKPVIGSIPLERCSDFRRFENHEFMWKIDAIFIEKSPWCNKYPLIVKKLLPITDFRRGVVENCMALRSSLSSYQSIVNFIIRTISSIECQAIILHSRCETAAAALACVEIYCPVLMVLPIDEQDESDYNCKTNLVRSLNLRRNIRCVTYTKEMNDCNYKPINYGIEYGRCCGMFETGDFIITLEVCKEDLEDVQEGVGDDVVILRAFYLPPHKTTEKFRYA